MERYTTITDEMFEEYYKCRDDIVYFTEKYINHNTPNGVKKLELYPYQIQILSDDKVTANTSRQIGFSLMSYIKIVHSIIFNCNKTIAYYTPSGHIATSSLIKISEILDLCTLPEQFKPNYQKRNKGELLFKNGNRVMGVSTITNLRGYSFSEFYINECDYIKDDIDLLLRTVMSTLISMGDFKFWAWSTPANGNINRLQEILKDTNGFNHYKLSWYVVPNRMSKWKNDIIKNIGNEQFNKEYNNK